MRSVVFYGPGDIRPAEMPVPEPGVGEARLKVTLAGVCATDKHITAGHFAVRPPRVLGHELVGVVEAVGPDTPPGLAGVACGVLPARFCGACSMCQSGSPQLCLSFQCLGNTHDGGYAEYTLVPADQLIPLGSLAPEAALLLEPLACVLQALDQVGGAGIAGPVLILGAGVLGKLMVLALIATTSARVGVVDPNASRVAAAVARGAAGWTAPRQGDTSEITASLRQWAPEGIPVIIDTSGSPEAIRRAVEWVAPKGKVLLFGVSGPQAQLRLSPHLIFSKEITLTASSGMAPAAFSAAEALLRSGRIDPSGLVGATISLEELPAHLLGQAPRVEGKILVRPVQKPGEAV